MTFPKCKPCFTSKIKMGSDDFRIRYQTLRNVSSHFAGRKDVREKIFTDKGRKCYICGSEENIQIDHVISVYEGAEKKIPYYVINSYDNLMPICSKCNSKKSPIQGAVWQDGQNRA